MKTPIPVNSKIFVYIPLDNDPDVSSEEVRASNDLVKIMNKFFPDEYNYKLELISVFKEPKCPGQFPAIHDETERPMGFVECIDYLIMRFGKEKQVRKYIRENL
ncbi:hypothetical protein KY304_00795 [Candidatus Woesearchaeota archaeon]|nr:hypothetical protein [Candidatus Woesearchaeota archaeon]MBW2978630.1 hypothetical protein [Candidatus Woesearchaeota archaeon]